MLSEQTQSVNDFRLKTAETLDRLAATGGVEILTENGLPRAVVLSPATYDELAKEAQLNRDVAVIRQSFQEIEQGKGRPAVEVLDEIRSELLAIKSSQISDQV